MARICLENKHIIFDLELIHFHFHQLEIPKPQAVMVMAVW